MKLKNMTCRLWDVQLREPRGAGIQYFPSIITPKTSMTPAADNLPFTDFRKFYFEIDQYKKLGISRNEFSLNSQVKVRFHRFMDYLFWWGVGAGGFEVD